MGFQVIFPVDRTLAKRRSFTCWCKQIALAQFESRFVKSVELERRKMKLHG